MSEARRIDPRRIYQQVADEIRGLIHGGRFAVGSRLPAERELALQLGVSRPSLREALVALEIEGSVEIRLGAGVFVTAGHDRACGGTVALGESPSELMHGRMTIEGPVVALACARMTPATLTVLRGTIDRMRSAVEGGGAPSDQDRLFHVTIARQSGNTLLTRIIGDLFDERHSRLSRQISTRFESRDTWAAALSEHESILAALESSDPLLAEAAMRQHLRQSAERWLNARP